MEINKKISGLVEELFSSQRNEWDMLTQNYDGLSTILQKEIIFDGFGLQLQCNPERIRSSVAKTDAVSILERPCFLCPANLPEKQKAIEYLHDYNILVNPFPIFRKHFTIADKQHKPQLIEGRIRDMLQLAIDLQDYIILYNGPASGASAPDHFHFQAGIKGVLPIEKDFHNFPGKKILKEEAQGVIYSMEQYLRKTIVYQSNSTEWLVNSFTTLFQYLEELIPPTQNNGPLKKITPITQCDEPMFNILTFYEDKQWNLVVFPRAAHRPSLYYEKGERHILFSPGVVDFAGLLIFPRKEDYDKINRNIIESIFKELTISDPLWAELLRQLNAK